MDLYRSRFMLPLFILIVFFFLPITSKGIVAGPETGEVIFRVLFSSAGRYVELAAGVHMITVVLIILLITYGNRVRRLFDAFVAGDYILIAFRQSIATIEDYGRFSILKEKNGRGFSRRRRR